MKTKREYAYILAWNKKIKAINLLGGKCEKCGEKRPWVLTFHHKNPNKKEFNIKTCKNYRWSKIKKEVLKCQLLCLNCHQEIHVKENPIDPSSKKIFLEIIQSVGCEICKYNKCNNSLNFHHEKEKGFMLGGGIRIRENSCKEIKEKIINEINKCNVLCANCHADLHFDKEKFEKYKDEIYNWKYKEQPKPVDKDLVIKMYKDGKRQIEISKELKCAKSTISGIIKKLW